MVRKAVEPDRSARRGRGRPRKPVDAPPSPDQLRRLRFIERSAFWTGRVGRQSIAASFDISPNHVSLDLGRYRALAPDNLAYDVTEKCFRPTDRFEPVFASDAPGDLLALIAGAAALPDIERRRLLGFDLPVETIGPPPVSVDPALLTAVCRAIANQGALEISYQSLATPVPVTRLFCPGRLIHTGQRWLVRGWDGEHQDYRDLALARLLEARPNPARPSLPADELWDKCTFVELAPAPLLSESQVAVVAREYGMSKDPKGRFGVSIACRGALIPYLLDRLQLRPTVARQKTGPVVLLNYDEIACFDRPQHGARDIVPGAGN